MIREDLFNTLLLVGFTIFLIVFILWAYQQYRLQKQVADEELASMRRTQYAIAQLYKSGALDPSKHKEKKPVPKPAEKVQPGKPHNKPIIMQEFVNENFEDGASSMPGADLPTAFVNALEKAKMSPDSKKLEYQFPSADFQMEFGAEGEKPDLSVDINAKNLKIAPPPRCSNVTNQYIYNLNRQILEQNKRAEEINKVTAQMNEMSSGVAAIITSAPAAPAAAPAAPEEQAAPTTEGFMRDPRRNIYM